MAFLALVAAAALLVAALAAAVRWSRRAAWMLAGALAGTALLLQWTVLEAIPLSEFTCGPLCGSRIEVVPAAIGAAAIAAAAILSLRPRWLPRSLRGAAAVSSTAVLLLMGTRIWVS